MRPQGSGLGSQVGEGQGGTVTPRPATKIARGTADEIEPLLRRQPPEYLDGS